MTDKELFARVRALGLKITKTDGEYRVNFRHGKEATAYYTTDKGDALTTAEAMLRGRLLHAEDYYKGDTPDSHWCMCAGLSDTSRLNPGIHHDEGCVMWQLPDYGVFGPDE